MALISQYTAILNYMSQVLRHYNQSSVKRIATSSFKSVSFAAAFEGIQDAQFEVDRLRNIAEAETANQTRIKNETDLRRLLAELQQPIDRISADIAKLQDHLEQETRVKILKSISTIPDTLHHKTVSKGRLPASGNWLLQKEAYKAWRMESSSSILWLHGIPGSGKSKLASSVIDEVRKTDHLAYFYCMRNPAEPHRAQSEKILASIVRQLARLPSSSAILEPVSRQHEEAIEGLGEYEDQEWTVEESRRVLIELSNIYPSVTLVIDALDEVNPADRPVLLDALNDIVAASDNLVKVFISSRENTDIVLRLESLPNVYIDARDNEEDICRFM